MLGPNLLNSVPNIEKTFRTTYTLDVLNFGEMFQNWWVLIIVPQHFSDVHPS